MTVSFTEDDISVEAVVFAFNRWQKTSDLKRRYMIAQCSASWAFTEWMICVMANQEDICCGSDIEKLHSWCDGVAAVFGVQVKMRLLNTNSEYSTNWDWEERK